jgi:hypothetical protein
MYWSSMGPVRRKNNPVAIASPTFHCASGTRSFALSRAIWGKAALQCISARGKHTLAASACAAHLDLIWLPGATPVKNRRFHAQNWIVYDMMWYDMIWHDILVYCIILYHVTLHYIILHYLPYIILCRIIFLFNIVLYSIISYCIVLYYYYYNNIYIYKIMLFYRTLYYMWVWGLLDPYTMVLTCGFWFESTLT